jgi:hypothetical protein
MKKGKGRIQKSKVIRFFRMIVHPNGTDEG